MREIAFGVVVGVLACALAGVVHLWRVGRELLGDD